MKTCTKCKTVKSESEFHFHKSHKDGLSARCKECVREDQREWNEVNPEKKKNKDKIWALANPRKRRATSLKRKFGITLEEYDQMWDAQNGRCAICGRHESEFKRRLFVDHDHKTGNVRGLLCDSCNRGLGYFLDNLQRLESASSYLKRPTA